MTRGSVRRFRCDWADSGVELFRRSDILMAIMKRRSPSHRQPSNVTPTPTDGPPAEASGRSATSPRCRDHYPTRRVRRVASAILLVHVLALAASFFAVVEPSETQVRVLAWLQPYLRMTRFGVDERPIYLAHGNRSEQPMRLQVSRTFRPGDRDWRTVEPQGVPGLASSDRYHRWLSTAVLLADSEQPGLVAELLLGHVAQDPEIRAVRIVVLPTELTTVMDDDLPPPFEARVARGGGRVSLVHVPPEEQSSIALPTASEADR